MRLRGARLLVLYLGSGDGQSSSKTNDNNTMLVGVAPLECVLSRDGETDAYCEVSD
jgi:hypothetical protein